MKQVFSFSEEEACEDPFLQFESWYRQYIESGASNHNAVFLGTASAKGQVSVRTVFVKEYGRDGFCFFTNINSRKAMHLAANPRAAMLFYWPVHARQVRIEGDVSLLPEEKAAEYFATRPRESQIGAWASTQSSVIPDRKHLEGRYDLFNQLFKGKPVEKPSYWGGYMLTPNYYEFWQEREYRLHDRITYTRKKDEWLKERLAP
ncbi:MAG: pyridoxamine 5'-phosphate oxidase [Bacteroidales bacterium]|jgi:pyridoxamine 5'-phosphate oxidase|nr:pyridoxamine 5'-phosphate oxidase [Bacteroidales bacterium]MCU0407689.1 pyridoxamine 5'-phosphate oxidase [Bacteroidales bacterium]